MHSVTCVEDQADSPYKLPIEAHINGRNSFTTLIRPKIMHVALEVSGKESMSPRTLVSLGYASWPAED